MHIGNDKRTYFILHTATKTSFFSFRSRKIPKQIYSYEIDGYHRDAYFFLYITEYFALHVAHIVVSAGILLRSRYENHTVLIWKPYVLDMETVRF